MSERCCNVADETAGAQHDVWCHSWDLDAALAAARSEGYAQARAEDIAALRDRDRWLEWWKTHPLSSFDEHMNSRAADYLASLTPTQEDGNA